MRAEAATIALAVAFACGCSGDAGTSGHTDGQAPKLQILDPAAKSKLTMDKNTQGKKFNSSSTPQKRISGDSKDLTHQRDGVALGAASSPEVVGETC